MELVPSLLMCLYFRSTPIRTPYSYICLSVWPHTEHLNPVDLPPLPSSYLSSRPFCIFRPVLRTTATIGARVRWILNLVPHPEIPTPRSTNEDKETGRQKGASTSGPRSANFFSEGRGWGGQRKFSFQAAEWFPFRLTVSRFFQSSWFFVPLRFLKQRTACFHLIVYLLLNLRWKLRVCPFEENNLRPARLMLFLKLVWKLSIRQAIGKKLYQLLGNGNRVLWLCGSLL